MYPSVVPQEEKMSGAILRLADYASSTISVMAVLKINFAPPVQILQCYGQAVDDPWGQGSQKGRVMSRTRARRVPNTRLCASSSLWVPAVRE